MFGDIQSLQSILHVDQRSMQTALTCEQAQKNEPLTLSRLVIRGRRLQRAQLQSDPAIGIEEEFF